MPSNSGRTVSFLDLLAQWNTAVESQDESLLSAIPSVLALFLKVISTELDFRDCGTALCKDLLQKEQLRLLDRGLTATKTKEHLLSPCIRLLTEAVSFDAGAVAGLLYSKRDTTLKRIDQFLNRKTAVEDKQKGSKKPSLRRITQRYVIANLKYQTAKAKTEIISDGTLPKAFLQGIRNDDGDIVLDMLDVIERDVLKGTSLTRSIKHRFLTYPNLTSIATLYTFEDESEELTTKVQQAAHGLLRLACTSFEDGILRKQTGWYPLGSSPDARAIGGEEGDYIDLGLDSAFVPEAGPHKATIRNTHLAAFAQNLHPDTSTLQMELLVDIFKAAPEVVADYFTKKRTFPTDPKPTAQWLGYSALIFSTINLPVPEHCGWPAALPLMPPPTEVVIENILPRPLDRQTLTRCLNMNHELITLFAIRALSAGFRKLRDVLSIYQLAPASGLVFWQQASAKLEEEFAQRCPAMKDLIATYHRTSKTDPALHEAVVELIALYFKHLPDLAMTEKFDVSLALVDVLSRLEKQEDDGIRQSLVAQLTQLLEIAQTSSDTKWWNKPESLTYSPFTSLLQVLAGLADDTVEYIKMRDLLANVCLEHGILHNSRALAALMAVLARTDGGPVTDTFFHALDQCVGRLVRRPVQYQDFAWQHSQGEASEALSLLAAALSEQSRYFAESLSETTVLPLVNQLYANLEAVGENKSLLDRMRQHIVDSMPKEKAAEAAKIMYASTTPWESDVSVPQTTKEGVQSTDGRAGGSPSSNDVLMATFGETVSLDVPTSSLQKWEKQDVEEAIVSGTVTGLIKCLGSVEDEVKRQAFLGIQRFMHRLESSDYPGWQAIFGLLGELVETIRSVGIDEPLPSIVVELGVKCMEVLTQPLSRLFGKVNRFLSKAPAWNILKLPSYWVDQLLMQEPEFDDGYLEEATWLLQLLVGGLKMEQDLEIYRRASILERVLAWSAAPSLPNRLRQTVLELVYKASQLDSTNTLVTRVGIISWLDIQCTNHGTARALSSALKEMIKGKVVKDDFTRWTGRAVDEIVQQT